MTCQTLSSILKSCENGNIGGIKSISVYDFNSSYTGGTQYTGSSVTIEFAKESGSYTQEVTSDISTGAISVAQTLTVTVPRKDSTKVNSIKILGAGQRDLMVKITDANGTVEYMGIARGSVLTKVSAMTGSKGGDANGYILTFSGAEPELS